MDTKPRLYVFRMAYQSLLSHVKIFTIEQLIVAASVIIYVRAIIMFPLNRRRTQISKPRAVFVRSKNDSALI